MPDGHGSYFVCKREGRWRLYDDSFVWLDTFDELEDAHTWAMHCAFIDEFCRPGGLTRLKIMLLLEHDSLMGSLSEWDRIRRCTTN